MRQNTKKPYDLPDWPAEAEQAQEAPRPRRKRRAPAEPEDLWGKLRFRAGKKVRWFGRRCRRVIREAYRGLVPAVQGGWDLVFVARSRTLHMKSTEVRRVMEAHLKKTGVLL